MDDDDFQKDPDGQLTIFFEDTHEPPDPDDFASIADYEIAWGIWEQTQTLPQQEDKIMNFSITTPFDSEIELLRAKLAELETQKRRVSTCANRIVEQVGECVVEMKEAGVSDGILTNWACVIYKEITGEDVPALSNLDVLKGAIAWERNEQIWRERCERIEAERDEARYQVEELEARHESDRVSEELKGVRASLAIANQETFDAQKALADFTTKQLNSEQPEVSETMIEGYKKTIIELTIANQKITEEVSRLRGSSQEIAVELREGDQEATVFELNDHVQVVQVEDDKSLLHRHGTIAGIADNQVSVLFHKTDELEECETILSADCLKILDGNKDIKTQENVSEFLRKLDRLSKVDKLDWVKIKELPLNLETMRELALQVKPKSKTHDYLMAQLPVMCADYIGETGDNSDLEWLPEGFKSKVEALLETTDSNVNNIHEDDLDEMARLVQEEESSNLPESSVKPGDIVLRLQGEMGDEDKQWKVLARNGEWVNVQDADGLTDMCRITDIELVVDQEAA